MGRRKKIQTTVGPSVISSPGSLLLQDFVKFKDQFSVYAERNDELNLLLYGVLLKEHVLLKGLPGTAKSDLTLKFLNSITGAKVFRQQFTAFMDESYIFGPQIIEELKKGRVVHNVQNSLVDCDYAYLDEFFNANEETIVACNEILNERRFTRNAQVIESPLTMAVLTTNQERENEKKLKPIYDRVIFNSKVQKVLDTSERVKMYTTFMNGNGNLTFSEFSQEDILKLHGYMEEQPVEFEEAVLRMFDALLDDFQRQTKLYISDRRAIKSLKFLKLVALLRGHNRVTADSLKTLVKVWSICHDLEVEGAFEACYLKAEKKMDQYEQATQTMRSYRADYEKVMVKYRSAQSYADYKQVCSMVAFLHKNVFDVSTDSSLYQLYEREVISLGQDVKDLWQAAEKAMKKIEAPKEEKVDDDWFAELIQKDEVTGEPVSDNAKQDKETHETFFTIASTSTTGTGTIAGTSTKRS